MSRSVEHSPHRQASYDVIRLVPELAADGEHAHVAGLVTRFETDGELPWTILDFVEAVRLGDRFKLVSDPGSPELQPAVCNRCQRITVATVRRAG